MKEPNKTLIYDLSDLSYRQFKKICLELFNNRYDRDEIEFFYNEQTHKDTVLIYNDRLKWSLHLKSLCKPTANALDLFVTKPEYEGPIKWDLKVTDLKEGSKCKIENKPDLNHFEMNLNVIGADLKERTKNFIFNPQKYYNNEKGSLYKIATERGWNSYVFDVVKRLDRGGKKDPIEQEIEKSIDVLKLWLIELKNK